MAGRFPGVILSGGKSSRMGEPKALLPFGGGRLIDHVAARFSPQVSRLYLNSNDPAVALAGVPSFTDRFAGFAGPLAGIHAGLACMAETDSAPATHVAFMAVDTPFCPSDLVERLAAALTGPDDIAIPTSLGQWHPVIGLWPLSIESRLAIWLADPPTLKVRAFLDGLPVRNVDFPVLDTRLGPLDPFFNVNTREDLEHASRLWSDLAGKDTASA